MTAPVNITIGGSAWTNALEDSITIQSYEGRTTSSMSATLYDKNCALAIPQEGVDIVVERGDVGGERLFGGLTSMIDGRTEKGAGSGRYWEIKSQSYGVLLDSTLFYHSFAPGFTYSGLVGDLAILKYLFGNCVVGAWGTKGLTSEIVVDAANCVQGLKAVSAHNVFYKTAREEVEYFSGLVGYNYRVDYNKNLHYYFLQNTAAPFGLSDSYNGTTTLRYRGLRYHRDATRLQNNTLVYGAAFKSDTQTDYFAGDGSTKTISIATRGTANPVEAPAGQTYISVWKNTGTDPAPVWTSQTVGIDGIDDPATKNCIWSVYKQTLTFTSAPANLTKSVKVSYAFSYTGGRMQTATDSVTQYGRVFSAKLVASDSNSIAAVESKLANIQKQYKSALVSVTCTVDDTDFPVGNTNRFQVGQWVPFVNSKLGLNMSLGIHSITTTIIGGLIRQYALELRNYVLG